MIAMVATFRAVAGAEAQFEAGFSALMAEVRANEPTTHLYQLCRSRTEPGVYKMLEIYESQADLDAHMSSEWLKRAAPNIRPYLAEGPVMEPLDPIA